MKTSIRFWAEEDRPREKLLHKGRHVLTDTELIAILIGTGTRNKSALDLARDLLASCDHDLKQLHKMRVSQLESTSGIGKAKAAKLSAVFELMDRVELRPERKISTIRSSKDAFELVRKDFFQLGHEEFYVCFMDRANNVLRLEMISKGGLSGTVADGKIIFKRALELQCCAIILFHNHPSGQLNPSEADRRLTKQLCDFGKLIDLQILDHLIVAEDNYFSFADEGLMR